MKKNVRIVDKDHGFKRLLAAAKEASKGAGLSVGIHAAEGAEPKKERDADGEEREGPMTVLDVAIWNEFGLGVPERSFLRAWYDEAAGKNRAALRAAMVLVLKGQKTMAEALELVGLKFVGDLQKKIAQGIPPPNAPSTIARKGSSKPLINTGQMRQALTFLVRSGRTPS